MVDEKEQEELEITLHGTFCAAFDHYSIIYQANDYTLHT